MLENIISMKIININHLRVIHKFSKDKKKYKISDYEKFLVNYVSIPTARKIIKQLIELKIVSVYQSKEDLRVKYLLINDSDIEKYL
jgi:DNA-binding MarR family transcriptional regulator